MTIARICLLIPLFILALAACGQRGPLYLPDESAPAASPARATQPAAVPPDPMDTGFEEADKPEDKQPEEEQADGL